MDDLDTCQICENFSMEIDSSVLQNQNGISQGAQEFPKKLKKLRSINLSKSPSLKPSGRRAKLRSSHFVSNDAAGSPLSSEFSSCSDTSSENLQNSARTLARRSSFKPVKSLTRIYSVKLKSSLLRKFSGGNRMNNLKKSRMANSKDSESSKPSARKKKYVSIDAGSSSPNFSKETCCSSERKAQFQASPHASESSYCSSSEAWKRSAYSKPNSKTSPGPKSPLNVSIKLARTKSKKSSMRKHSETSQCLELSVLRPTCSSALKGSKYPNIRGLQTEGAESEGISAGKVCPFTYCSPHGHCQANVPPLKRLISIRRRMLKNHRGMTPATQPQLRGKRSGKIEEDHQTNQMVCTGTGGVHEATSPVGEKLGRELFLEINAEPEAKPSGLGTYSENGEDNNNFSNAPEKMLDETSCTHIHIEDSLHRVEQQALVSLSTVDDLSPENTCIGTDLVAINTDRKEEKIVASNYQGGAQSIGTDNLSSSDPKSIGKPMKVDDFVTVKVSDQFYRPDPEEVAESNSYDEDNDIYSAPECEALEEQPLANEMKDGTMLECMSNRTTKVEQIAQPKDHKYIRMWQLMYKHAVKGTTNVEKQLPLDVLDKEEQVEGTTTVFETNNLSFSETDEHIELMINCTAEDRNMELCRYDATKMIQEAFDNILLPEFQDCSDDDQSFISAISSDQEVLEQTHGEGGEHSTSTTIDSSGDSIGPNIEETWAEAENTRSPREEKTVPKLGDKMGKKTPKSWSSFKKFILLKRFFKAVEKVRNLNYQKQQWLPQNPDPEAEKVNLRQLRTEKRKNAEEWMIDYALQQVIFKLPPAQQRRVALLVEAFETVLPFPEIKTSQSNVIDFTEADLRECNGSSVESADHKGKESDCGTSTEIFLGSMPCSEKRLSEYPAQVSDLQMENQQSPVSFSKLKESSTTDHCCIKRDITASEVTHEDHKEKQIVSINTGDRDDKTEPTNVPSSAIKDPRLCHETSLKGDKHGSIRYECLVNETVQEAPKEGTSIINSKMEDIKLETNNLIIKIDEQSDSSEDQIPGNHAGSTEDNMFVSLASLEPTDKPMAAREEMNREASPGSSFIQGFPALGESHPDRNVDVPHETQLGKRNYSNLWFLVYKHMVSSIAPDDGEKPVDDANRLPGLDTLGSCESLSEMDQGLNMKSHNAENKKIQLQHIEAIKLQVENTIDEIVIPENQDESGSGKPNTVDLIPEQEPLEKKVAIEGKPFISTSTFSDNFGKHDDGTIQQEEKAVTKLEDTPNKKMSKNWSNLKKMILLNRFIKALENMKKFNPREPRYLPLEPDPEAEKVHLKHLNLDGRKNSEEWMLDYALQQAVARLTPARKRKVSLLVDAFETVIPNNGIPNPFKPQVSH